MKHCWWLLCLGMACGGLGKTKSVSQIESNPTLSPAEPIVSPQPEALPIVTPARDVWAEAKVIALPAPPFEYVLNRKDATEWKAPKFTQLNKANKDPANSQLGQELQKQQVGREDGFPETLGNRGFITGFHQGPRHIALYGENNDASVVAILSDGNPLPVVFDFTSYLQLPAATPGELEFVKAAITWVQTDDKVLYITTGHRTYASSSLGKNAFVSAIDLTSGELIWQSQSLVSNARNFELTTHYVLCGYGFTNEPDYLYALSRSTGRVLARQKVESGPEILIRSEDTLTVETYNRGYVFALSEQ